jgi:hypothetical protein
MPVIPVLRRLKQETHEFEATLGYIVRSCLKKNNQTNKQTKKPLFSSYEKNFPFPQILTNSASFSF